MLRFRRVSRRWLAVPALVIVGACAADRIVSDDGGSGGNVPTVVLPALAPLTVGGTQRLTARATQGGADTTDVAGVAWTSSDAAVARVTDGNLLTAVSVGAARITAAYQGASADMQVQVIVAPVATVRIVQASVTLLPGASRILDLDVRDANGEPVDGRPVTWSSSDPTVATVDAGTLRAVRTGSATISATVDDRVGTSQVTVGAAPVSGVQVTLNASSIAVAQVTSAVVVLRDAGGNVLTGRDVAWTSSNSGIASIDAGGIVHGVAVGTVTMIATSEGRTGSANLTVTPQVVASIALTPSTLTIPVGTATTIAAVLRDAGGNVLTGRQVAWTSSAAATATVDGSGRVAALAPGTTTVTASVEGVSATASVTVVPVGEPTPLVTPASASVMVGGTVQLGAQMRDAAGNTLPATFTWRSASDAIATVSPTGQVTGVAAGTTNIVATADGRSASATVTVNPVPVASVTLAPTSLVLVAGQSGTLVATCRDAAGNALAGRTVSWSTSAAGVATVDAVGLVQAVAAGSATMTATCEGRTATAAVTVTAVPVASVTVTPTTGTLQVGSTLQLTATLRDAAGNTLTGRTVTWTRTPTGTATVSSSGLVSATAIGTATVTATSGSVSGSATITVTRPLAASVTVAPTAVSLTVGGTAQLTATARDAAGTVIPGATVTWSGSNTAIARISASGLVTAVTSGTTTVTALVDGRSATAAISVAATPTGALGCANPQLGWIWCDDFEQDRTARYFEVNPAGGSFTRAAVVGRAGTTGMRARFAAGQSEAGSLKLAFGRTPDAYFRPVDAGTANYREVYWRVWVRHNTGWTGGGGDKLSRATIFHGSNWSQAMIAHVWSGGSTASRDYLLIDPASGTDAAGNVVTTSYNDFARLRWLGARSSVTPMFAADRVGRWYCVESRVRLNDAGQANGVFQLWIDEALEAQRTDLDWVGAYSAYGINAVFLENFWNSGSPVAQERYLDDFVVSTQRIGCGGSTGSAPVAAVSVAVGSNSIEVGATTPATAIARDASGSILSGRPVIWTSSNTAVATVDGQGQVSGRAAGSATITGTAEGVAGSVTVTVRTPAPPTAGVPAPAAGAAILLDMRQALQQATTLDQAFGLFGVRDRTGNRGARNSSGWSFTTNADGQGLHALRADWGASAADQRIMVIHYLPAPKPTELYVQWKGRTGKHPADPDANGTDNSYAYWPESNSCKRALFLRGDDRNRVDFVYHRSNPTSPKLEMGAQNYARYGNTAVWNPNAMVGRTFTTTIYVKAASSSTATDGIFRLWIDGTLVMEQRDVPMGATAFDRWQFPDTCVTVPQPQAEYFWDILAWEP